MGDSSCKDPFKTDGAKTVPCKYQCLKVKVDDLVTRSCSRTRLSENDQCNEAEVLGKETQTCVCDGHRCNTAAGVHPMWSFAVISVVSAMLIRRLA